MQFVEEEFHIVREVRSLCLEGSAYEENGVRTIDLVHLFKELPAHSAGGYGEARTEIGHLFHGAFADFLAGIGGEGETAPKAGENDGIGAGKAGKLSVVAERRNAGILIQHERTGEAGMKENGQVEIRVTGQIANHGKSRNGRSCHDAVSTDFLCLIGTVQELQSVSGAVGNVHGFLSGLFFGISQGHDALEHSFFKPGIALIHKAVIIFDNRAAAKCQIIDHFGEFFRSPAQGFDGGHEDGSSRHAAEVSESHAAKSRSRIIIVHAFRQFEAHEFHAGLETCISKKHIDKFCHFIAHRFGIIGNGGIVGARFRRFFDFFHLAHNGFADGSPLHQFIGAFHRLFHGDIKSQFFGFFIIGSHDAVGGGKAGRYFQIFGKFCKKFTLKKWNITHISILSL